jgi:hypothetical protein
MSTTESRNCRIEEGPDGKLVQKCEILRRVLRRCPGKPVDEIESRREETTTPVGSGAESFSMQQQQDPLPFPNFEDHLEQGLGGFLSSMEKMFSTVFENEFPQPGERKHNSNEMPMPRPFGSFPRFEHFHDNRKQKQEKNNKSGLGGDFQEA